MCRGRIKWTNNKRMYGFSEYEGLVNEGVLVKYTVVDQYGYKSLKQDELVNLKLIRKAKGCQSVDIREEELILL